MSTTILHIEKKETLVPKLRFKDFDGEWKLKRLGGIAKITTGSTPSTHIEEYYNGEKLFVSPADIQDNRFVFKTKTTLTEVGFNKGRKVAKGSVLFVCIGSTIGKVAQVTEECLTNQQINALYAEKGYDNNFIYELLEKNGTKIKLLAGVQAVPQINKTDFSNFKYFVPTLPEQQKIASFLSAVDEKIQQLSRKKELLEQYKKGVMQQLFSGKLRFKDENGEDYPDWEEKKLGEVSINISYGMNAAATTYDGKNKYLRITDIDESSNGLNVDKLTSPNGILEDKFRVKEGDLLFARTGASVGKSYLYRNNDGILYFAGFLIRFHIKKAIPAFVYLQTQTSKYDKWVKVMSMRSGQPGINAEEYKTYEMSFPCIEEQQKIANFLSCIDVKIENTNQHITQTQSFKKGLLQQMFV